MRKENARTWFERVGIEIWKGHFVGTDGKVKTIVITINEFEIYEARLGDICGELIAMHHSERKFYSNIHEYVYENGLKPLSFLIKS